MEDTVFDKFTRCAKVCGLFFLIVFSSGADWLGRQTKITWYSMKSVTL